MPNLQSTLESEIAKAVVTAFKGATLDEIYKFIHSEPQVPVMPRRDTVPADEPPQAPPRVSGPVASEMILNLLGISPLGLGAEDIRNQLNLDKRDVVRLLAAGLADKTIRKSGEKRATKYFKTGRSK